MDWKNYYKEHTVSAAEAVSRIKSGQRVVMGHAMASPEVLGKALVERTGEVKDVRILHMVAMGASGYCLPENKASFRHESLFAGGPSRRALTESRAEYIPCFFSEMPDLLRSSYKPDVAMVIVSPPDEFGYVSLGIGIDYARAAVEQATVVLAEVNPNMPRTMGNSFIHVSEIDCFVPADVPLLSLTPPPIGETEMRIGENVASLIKDGDCLQLGIGGIPDAALQFLQNKNDLGIHSEMISDGVMKLADKGIVTGKRKQIHVGKILIGFAMGTPAFYKWLNNNPQVEMQPGDYVNDPRVIMRNDNMVSVNSAISVDMLGQVAADMLGPAQFSGVGGQVDFVRGAKWSKGGRSIIAMPATAAKGTKSRISVMLAPGQGVTTSRHDVDHIVTEYGVARLRGRTVRERAGALIGLAAPQFREELREETIRIFGWTPVAPE